MNVELSEENRLLRARLEQLKAERYEKALRKTRSYILGDGLHSRAEDLRLAIQTIDEALAQADNAKKGER